MLVTHLSGCSFNFNILHPIAVYPVREVVIILYFLSSLFVIQCTIPPYCISMCHITPAPWVNFSVSSAVCSSSFPGYWTGLPVGTDLSRQMFSFSCVWHEEVLSSSRNPGWHCTRWGWVPFKKKKKKKIPITISWLVTVAECNFFDILFMKSVLTKDYITHTDGEPSLWCEIQSFPHASRQPNTGSIRSTACLLSHCPWFD